MPIFVLILCLISLFLYFIPAIVGRNKGNATAIFWLNFLLGWTMVGWVVALVWALTKESATQVVVNQATPTSSLCVSCGKYSASGTRFCAMCGAAMTT